jgi:hypothetical protein
MNRQRVQDPRRRRDWNDRDDERGWLGPGDELANEQNWRGQCGGYGEPGQPLRERRAVMRPEEWRSEPQPGARGDREREDPNWSRYGSNAGPDWRRMGGGAEPRRSYGETEGMARRPREFSRGEGRWQNAGRINDVASYGGPSGIREGVEGAQRFRETDDHQPGVGEGPYAGRGPRGYVRSDERIREEIIDRLIRESWLDPTDVDVQVENGEVTLTGAVETRREKRLAADLAEAVPGVRNIFNRIRLGRRIWES